MRVKINASLDYNFPQPADVLLAVRVPPREDQRVISDELNVSGNADLAYVADAQADDPRSWLAAAGPVLITYSALVEVTRGPVRLAGKQVPPRAQMPGDVITYLMPSHYCSSPEVENFARGAFGHLIGGDQVLAMADWISGNFQYVPGASNGATTAADTFRSRQGVCRDYAHVLISFARAVGIPARMVSVYAPGIQPPDFHAVVEVWLEGSWHLIDPSRLSREDNLVRIATGRDATDISFMTIFGMADLRNQSVDVSVAEPVEQH